MGLVPAVFNLEPNTTIVPCFKGEREREREKTHLSEVVASIMNSLSPSIVGLSIGPLLLLYDAKIVT